MPLFNQPTFGQPYTFYITLQSQANSTGPQVNPTIAAGDFKRSIDGGARTNFDTLPVVDPAGSEWVKCVMSAAEMSCQNLAWSGIDAAGAEWMSVTGNWQPTSGLGVIEVSTAQAVGAATLTLRSADTYGDNELAGATIAILSATTGAGQSRSIASNVGATDVVTVDPAWTTTPTGTVIYAIYNTPPGATTATTAIRDAIFARQFDATKMAGYTFEELTGFMASTLLGILSGAVAGSPSNIVIKNLGNTATAVAAPSNDASGNRPAVTLTPTAVR